MATHEFFQRHYGVQFPFSTLVSLVHKGSGNVLPGLLWLSGLPLRCLKRKTPGRHWALAGTGRRAFFPILRHLCPEDLENITLSFINRHFYHSLLKPQP